MGNVIYLAIGDFSEDTRVPAKLALSDFELALRRGQTPEVAANQMPQAVRPHALQAAALIRDFESRTQKRCGIWIKNNWSVKAGIPQDRSISLENQGDRTFEDEFAEPAANVARSLAALLEALGATKTIAANRL